MNAVDASLAAVTLPAFGAVHRAPSRWPSSTNVTEISTDAPVTVATPQRHRVLGFAAASKRW